MGSIPTIDEKVIIRECDRIRRQCQALPRSRQHLRSIFRSIDLTTLEATDTAEKVRKLCARTILHSDRVGEDLAVAAVCVHPTFVREAKQALLGSGVMIASVAGAFPLGQSPLQVKLAEVKFAIEEGADEIDVVINRGKFLEGEFQFVFDEIAAMKESCGEAKLKVILETGELGSLQNIRIASDLAIAAGADFIKTSTGKAAIGATLEAAVVMLGSIRDHFQRTGERIGLKPSGGIRKTDDALHYLFAVKQVLGDEWLDPALFRIGASSLLDDLIARLEAQDPADR